MKKQEAETTETLPAVPKVEKNISDSVLVKVNQLQKMGELKLPPDYNAANALKSAFLILTDSGALEKADKNSVANALLKMVVMGLNPIKKQCSFILYGTKLNCQEEYAGNIALAKRYGGLKWIKGNAIFEGDTFEFSLEDGRRKVTKHLQTLESISSKNVKGAYAIYELQDGTVDVEIMSITQIKDAWNQGPMKGKSPAHTNFPDQMSIKTVINRACKLLIRSSDDAGLYTEEETIQDPLTAKVKQEINDNSNAENIEFTEVKHDVETEFKAAPTAPIVSQQNENEESGKKETAEVAPNGQTKLGMKF